MAGKSEPFKVGDVVKLKSGEPKMTVTRVADRAVLVTESAILIAANRGDYLERPKPGTEYVVYCKWFAGSKIANDSFPHHVLDIVAD